MRLLSRAGARLATCLLLAFSGVLRAETEIEKATELMKARSFPEAQAVLERAVKADPRDAEALALLGKLNLATRHPDKAIEYADKAIQVNPKKAVYQVLRGRALGARMGDVGLLKKLSLAHDMRDAFEKGVQLEPGDRTARLALFGFYMGAPGIAGGGLEKASTFAAQTLALDPSRGHYMKAQVLDRKKDLDAALAESRLAQAADPQYADVYNQLGYLELEMKHVDAALEHFRKQVELAPDEPNSHDSLGDGLMAKGLVDDAIAAYRKALSVNPRFFASMRSLGSVLEKAGRRDDAIQHYRQCVQLGTREEIPEVVKQARARLKALGAKE